MAAIRVQDDKVHQGIVAHPHHSTYSGGRKWEDKGLRLALAKEGDPISTNGLSGGMCLSFQIHGKLKQADSDPVQLGGK
jgi:hypothetical protein